MHATDVSANGPLVTVLLPTYNRRDYLPDALGSVVRQTYRNLQIIVANDGGDDVRDIVEAFGDGRIAYLTREVNRGKAATLNEALAQAEGRYVAYIDDDDLWYPHHVATLVAALEGSTECQVAYSNLLRTTFRPDADGSRLVVSKLLEIRRDFDRCFMFHFNQALHVSLMHRRDLLKRTGPYNEQVRVLIDWDMTRRLCFFSDFLHVEAVTGEYCVHEQKQLSDRISFRMRQRREEFNFHFYRIRINRPPKPWPKVRDLSILISPDHMDQAVAEALVKCIRMTFWPFLIYLAMPASELERVQIADMHEAVVSVPVPRGMPYAARIDAAAAVCEGDCLAILPVGLPLEDLWVERPLHALLASARPREGFLVPKSGQQRFSGVFRKDEFIEARRRAPALPIQRSMEAAGIALRHAAPEEHPLQFDAILHEAFRREAEGDWPMAVKLYEGNRRLFANDVWMKERVAWALNEIGSYDDRVLHLCREVDERQPSIDLLLLEAQVLRRRGDVDRAVEMLQRARDMLEWKA